jgi:hypothetical protein
MTPGLRDNSNGATHRIDNCAIRIYIIFFLLIWENQGKIMLEVLGREVFAFTETAIFMEFSLEERIILWGAWRRSVKDRAAEFSFRNPMSTNKFTKRR